MKIAEGLILRKQLVQKIEELSPLKVQADKGYFKETVTRIQATAPIPGADQGTNEQTGTDDVTVKSPLITADDIFKSWDEHCTALRKLDAALQEANWKFTLTDVKLPKGLE